MPVECTSRKAAGVSFASGLRGGREGGRQHETEEVMWLHSTKFRFPLRVSKFLECSAVRKCMHQGGHSDRDDVISGVRFVQFARLKILLFASWTSSPFVTCTLKWK
jgi:hypothetical protein